MSLFPLSLLQIILAGSFAFLLNCLRVVQRRDHRDGEGGRKARAATDGRSILGGGRFAGERVSEQDRADHLSRSCGPH